MNIFNVVKKVIAIVKKKYEISKYNSFNIAEYFRKQGAQVGEDCHICVNELSTEPYLIKIGNHVGISSGTKFITHDTGWNFRDKIPDLHVFGTIEIGDNTDIGENSIILPNVKIGANCIIGSGSIITKDIPPNSIAAGVPARVIGNLDDYYCKVVKRWDEQKPAGFMKEVERGKKYSTAYLNEVKSKPENKEILKKHLIEYFWGSDYGKTNS